MGTSKKKLNKNGSPKAVAGINITRYSKGSGSEEVSPLSVAKSVSNSKWKDPKTWPPSLHDFIARSFKEASTKNFNSTNTAKFKSQLKSLINMAIESDRIMRNDWDKQEVPLLIGSKSEGLSLYCDNAEIAQKGRAGPEQNISTTNGAKRKNIFGEDESDSEDVTLGEKEPKAMTSSKSISLGDSLKKLKKQKKEPATLPASLPSIPSTSNQMTNQQLKDLRSKRFERELSIPVNHNYKDDVVSTKPIVGRNNNLEKKYLRLTSQPNPDTVRPLKVLKKTLQLLFDKYFDGASYSYLCDQCKSMRQDLTVQNIRHDFTIMAYEFHSKIAIENGDWGEFNQCQSQLKELYAQADLTKPHYFEFLGYRVLYYILTGNNTEVYELELDIETKGLRQNNDDFFSCALELFRHISSSNYYLLSQTVCKIYNRNKEERRQMIKTNDKGRLLITHKDALLLKHNKSYFFTKFVESIMKRENVRSLSTLCAGYRQLPVEFLKRLLCFEDDTAWEGFVEANRLGAFLNDNKTLFNCHQAKYVVEELKNQMFKKIDIKGQI
ncbi:unnamed protein product [Pichia kudriavzevii]